ncbi:MAG: protease complex subunit PrcB family protein [Candidatus Methanoperedens sp.]|nr:protease complex subunit PrcB family protein [Candidatus Methanoperedens sp.]MCZ7394649.1 protease complex subunit PrcB family protein [Candidatus Methanoperedens sp.]
MLKIVKVIDELHQPTIILLTAAITVLASLSGCVTQPQEKLQVNPEIDLNPLGGFSGKSEEIFIVLNGSIPEVKERLNSIVIKKALQPSAFSVNDALNFVVFRGVFSTSGYGIAIDRVEKQGNEFAVFANYTDPGKGMVVAQVITQPTVIIPIGKLGKGNYKASLKVTKEVEDKEGRKVIETEKELKNIEFSVE